MSFYRNIQIAFDKRLSLLPGGAPIAWENVAYKPSNNVPYLRSTLLMSPSSLMTVEDLQLNQGMYQIDLIYPTEYGTDAALTKLDAVYDHFKAVLTLTAGGVTVYIKQISRSAIIEIDKAWLKTSIEVNFKCYEN